MLHYPISINVILKNVSLFLPETTGPYKKTQPLAGLKKPSLWPGFYLFICVFI